MTILKKHGLIFAGGVATAIAAKSVLKSKTIRNLAVKTIAAGMKLQEDAAYEFETLREDAEDIVEEKKRQESNVNTSDEI